MRLLIIEDEPKIAHTLKRALELQSYAVDVVHDSENGLAFARDEPYDVIILDYMLPGPMDGAEICATLRREGVHVPILMLTARDGVNNRVAGLDAGADDYMVKPFALEEVFARIRTLLRRSPDAKTDSLQAAGLVLYTQRHAAECNGQELQLTPKEYAVLEYLLRNKDQVVTKDMIIAHVWDYDADVLPNTVEAVIRHIRAKLGRVKAGGKPTIRTVYGFGYRIEA